MANVKISELPLLSGSLATDDVVPIVDASTSLTKKATFAQVYDAIPAATTSSAGTLSATDKIKLDGATASATNSTLVSRDSSGNTAVNVLTASQVTINGTPTNATDAATKAYVDGVAVGLTIKAAVVAATTSNISLSGGAPITLDGVSLSAGFRILVKDQSVSTQNGLYVVGTLGSGSNGTWTRATDADTGAELPTGSYVFVNGGTTNGTTSWVMNSPGLIVIGTTPIVWVLFSQIGSVPASSITGSIVGSQIADAAINTAKFAAGLTPVELVSVMPNSGNFEGRTVYLKTTDGSFAADKIYRWTSPSVTTGTTFWTAAVPAVDITGNLTDSQIADLSAAKLTGQITATQITDGAITTPKLLAGSVTTAKIGALQVTANEIATGAITAGKIFTGAVTAGKIDVDAVTAGTIAAAAVNTRELATDAVRAGKIFSDAITARELATNAVTAVKILAGTITADKMNVTSLSAITANLGTITAGSITGTTITASSGTAAVSITSGGLSIASGKITLTGDGTNPMIRVFGNGSYTSDAVAIVSTSSGALPPFIQCGFQITLSKLSATFNSIPVRIDSSAQLMGTGGILLNPGSGDALDMLFGEDPTGGSFTGYLTAKANGRTVKIPFYT